MTRPMPQPTIGKTGQKNPPELVIAQITTMNEFTRTYTSRCVVKSWRFFSCLMARSRTGSVSASRSPVMHIHPPLAARLGMSIKGAQSRYSPAGPESPPSPASRRRTGGTRAPNLGVATDRAQTDGRLVADGGLGAPEQHDPDHHRPT